MPYEIQSGRYLQTSSVGVHLGEEYGVTPTPCVKQVPLVFNFQHDVESLWWVALWVVTYGTDYYEDTRRFVSAVFCNQLQPSSERTGLLTGPEKQPNSVFSDQLMDVGTDLFGICAYLRNQYISRETDNKLFDITTYSHCYSVLSMFLQKFLHLDFRVQLVERDEWPERKRTRGPSPDKQQPTPKRRRNDEINRLDRPDNSPTVSLRPRPLPLGRPSPPFS
jgi:hypothetical protein